MFQFLSATPPYKISESQRQIYKTLGGTPGLDATYTVFGEVLDGMAVIDSIAAQPTGPGDRPIENIRMKIEVIKE